MNILNFFILLIILFLFAILIYVYNYNNIENFTDDIYGNYKVSVRKSDIANRGVFADQDFKTDDIIEICPYIKDKCTNFIGLISDYIFNIDNTKDKDRKCGSAMGYFALYNHKDDNNATWIVDDEKSIITIKAIKDISKDEEIFVNYGTEYWNSRSSSYNKK